MIVVKRMAFAGPAVSSGCADAAGHEVGCEDPAAVLSTCFDSDGIRAPCSDATPGGTPGVKPPPKKKPPATPPAPGEPPKPGVPWWAWLAGGVGIAAILVGAFGARRR